MSIHLTDTILKLGSRLPLNVGERLVLMAVCFRGDDAGECGFSQADIAAQLGIGKSAVCRIFARLRALGIVEHRIPHGISIRLDILEGYAPAPVGSGKLYAGETETREKALLREQPKGAADCSASNASCLPSNADYSASNETGSAVDGVAPRATPIAPRATGELLREQQKVAPRATPIYKTDIKDTQDSVRVRAEALPASRGAAAPTPPQDDDRVIVSGGHTRPAVPEDFHAAAAFRRAYPKPPRNLVAFKAAWAAMERDGFGDGLPFEPAHLMAALERAKASKAWQEEGGRFVPRPEVFLSERQYLQYLTATERTPPAQRNARAMAGLESVLASMAHCGFAKEELARLRAKATPHVLDGMAPDRAVERVMSETSTTTERI